MDARNTLKHGFINASGAVAYIALVAMFVTNVPRILGETPGYLGIIMFLLTFVISAAVMSMLVFGRPVMWYLDGAKNEAVSLAITTVGFLILFALLVFAITFTLVI